MRRRRSIQDLKREEQARTRSNMPVNRLPPINILAISGGGDDGAFAAGLLAGWGVHGDRPQFKVVTGISAGALIAPFAFLGPAYDRQLVAMWTRYGAQDLIVKKPLAAVFGGSALADTGPLADLIAQQVDQRIGEALGLQHAALGHPPAGAHQRIALVHRTIGASNRDKLACVLNRDHVLIVLQGDQAARLASRQFDGQQIAAVHQNVGVAKMRQEFLAEIE